MDKLFDCIIVGAFWGIIGIQLEIHPITVTMLSMTSIWIFLSIKEGKYTDED